MSGEGPPSPSDYSQSRYYQGESSTGTAATSGVHGQIASDFEYAKQLQAEMEGLNVEDDGMTFFCSSPSNRTVPIHIS
jgi:E3 ubiquitin-protein ligase BIG BROTHER and related proteins